MRYIKLSDLCNTIRNNIYKIPHDVDAVIGVPRSGMIAASIVSEYLNIPLGDVNTLVFSSGDRMKLFESKPIKKVLVIDDSTFSGKSMRETKEKLKNVEGYEFIYCVVYLEGDKGAKEIDLYLEDMRHEDKGWGNICLYEWNLFNHYPHVMAKIMWDLDGVFCLNPLRDDNEEEYLEFIKNATPLFTPKVKLNKIVTYRCVKYYEQTKEWLNKNGIHFNFIAMVNAQNYIERNQVAPSSAQFKAEIYKNDDAQLFIESEENQAEQIWKLANKPVLCVKNNKLYGEEL